MTHDRDRAGEQRLRSVGRAVPMPCRCGAYAVHMQCRCNAHAVRMRRGRASHVRCASTPLPRGESTKRWRPVASRNCEAVSFCCDSGVSCTCRVGVGVGLRSGLGFCCVSGVSCTCRGRVSSAWALSRCVQSATSPPLYLLFLLLTSPSPRHALKTFRTRRRSGCVSLICIMSHACLGCGSGQRSVSRQVVRR